MLSFSVLLPGGAFPADANPTQYTMPWWIQQLLEKNTEMYDTPFGYDASKPLFVTFTGGGSGDGAILSGNSTVGKANVNGSYELLTHDASVLSALAGLATETKLEAVRLLLASLDGKDYATAAGQASALAKLTSLDGKDYATSAKQDDLLTAVGGLATQTKLEAVRLLLASLDAKDYATNAKLEECRVLLSTLSGKDFATAAKQDAAKSVLDQIYTAVDGVEALLVQIRDKDFATSAKQDTLKTSVDDVKAAVDAVTTALGVNTAAVNAVKTSVDTYGATQATAEKQDLAKARLDLLASEAKLEAVRALLESINSNSEPTEQFYPLDTGLVVVTPLEPMMWKRILTWQIPATQNYVPSNFSFMCGSAGYTARLAEQVTLGAFNRTGSVFTDGAASADNNDVWSDISVEVTTQFSGGSNTVVLSINYLDQNGNASTMSVSFVKGAAVGARYQVPLAAGDTAVKDVTGISLTSDQTAGAVTVFGTKEISSGGSITAGAGVYNVCPGDSIRAGRNAVIEMITANNVSATMKASANGKLRAV